MKVEKPVPRGEVAKKPAKPAPVDISKLTLEEIHNLPRYKACRELLDHAAEELGKQPKIQVMVNDPGGLAENIDRNNIFYLKPAAEKYPMDASIRSYKCPDSIKNVKVVYSLVKGPDYKSWYSFSNDGDVKGVDTSSPTNPSVNIKALYGDRHPDLVLKISKAQIVSLSPPRSLVNGDMKFTLNSIIFSGNKISYEITNKAQKKIFLKKIELTAANYSYRVDFSRQKVIVAPNKTLSTYSKLTGTRIKAWYVDNGNKVVRLLVKVFYQIGGRIKELHADIFARVKDLGLNEGLQEERSVR